MPRITQVQHKRSIAAYKGQITRLKKLLAKKAKARRRTITTRRVLEVGELVLYEFAPPEKAIAFQRWESFPVIPSGWVLHIEELLDGVIVAEGDLEVPAMWDDEAASKLVTREIAAWHQEQKAAHPEWADESPRVFVTRLALRRGAI